MFRSTQALQAGLASFALAMLALSGCGSESRVSKSHAKLIELRNASDSTADRTNRAAFDDIVAAVKARQDDYAAGRQSTPPVINILIISGGGDWGAFGAGFLKGWLKVDSKDPLALPQFNAVTGVSTGALIAPFAYLGDERSIDRINELYRNPKSDWVKTRGLLYFLPSHISFAAIPGLERELRQTVDMEMIRKIAHAWTGAAAGGEHHEPR